MNNNERETGVDNQLNSYVPRPFLTTDARQLAYDNFEALTFRQSGLTGAMPIYNMGAAFPSPIPTQVVQVNGVGGTPSPISNNPMPPLVNDPQFAETFIRNVTGQGALLY